MDDYDPYAAREYALTEYFYNEQRRQRMWRIESDRREYRESQLRHTTQKSGWSRSARCIARYTDKVNQSASLNAYCVLFVNDCNGHKK